MSIWDSYPADYRSQEVQAILSAVRAGECVAVIGLSGAGKSNLLGFLACRANPEGALVLVDCNRLPEASLTGFFQLVQHSLQPAMPSAGSPAAVEAAIAARLQIPPQRLCLLLDRFDALDAALFLPAASSLRALRDAHKYQLTYVIAARRPPDPRSELAELFYAHTLWLGPLSPADARWSAAQFAQRRGLAWDDETLQRLIQVSWGYPSLLRAVCEAAADGCALEIGALRAHPAIQQRVSEFWSDSPTAEDLRRSGLEGQPLLARLEPAGFDLASLTAKELLLLEYFHAHPNQVCEKDELIRAVWPEDKVYLDGIRDDSLAQLVRRLRRKIEPDPANPVYIHNVPGRGYLFKKP